MFSEKTKVLKARRGSPEKKSVSPRWHRVSIISVEGLVGMYVFEVLEQVGHSLPLTVGEDGFVKAIAGPS
jgi:hypothetical protein